MQNRKKTSNIIQKHLLIALINFLLETLNKINYQYIF